MTVYRGTENRVRSVNRDPGLPSIGKRKMQPSVLKIAAVFCMTAWAVLVGLAVARQLPWQPALLAAALAFLAALVAASAYRRRVGRTIAWLDRGAVDEPPLESPFVVGVLDDDLRSALARFVREQARQRRVEDEEGEMAAQIVAGLPDPLLTLDRQGRVLTVNDAAADMVNGNWIGRDLRSVIRDPSLVDTLSVVLAGDMQTAEVTFSEALPVARSLAARIFRLPELQSVNAAVAVVFHDLTDLRKAETMRGDFIANVSHELRTPLASMVGFIETLQGPAKDDPSARHRFLVIIEEQANRMARLIEDLLSLSRIEQREHTAPRDTVDLAPIVDRTFTMLAPQAREKGMRLSFEQGDLSPVLGDADELAEVFQNLIENAVRYGRSDTDVTVAAGAAGDRLTVSVIDQGTGIASEEIPRLTERFYRVDKARSREVGGTGLGLAIVKHIVNRHRGTLTSESALGEGSRFSVSLPLAPAQGTD